MNVKQEKDRDKGISLFGANGLGYVALLLSYYESGAHCVVHPFNVVNQFRGCTVFFQDLKKCVMVYSVI